MSFLEVGHFPDFLKVARVTPVFKAGDPTEFGNYRPMSALSAFSKVLERIIQGRILGFLNLCHIQIPSYDARTVQPKHVQSVDHIIILEFFSPALCSQFSLSIWTCAWTSTCQFCRQFFFMNYFLFKLVFQLLIHVET